MAETCRKALDLGLTSIAFTEHADWVRGPGAVVDLQAYVACVDRCRALFPDLRILSGVEMGEPHHHSEAARELLAGASFDRTLASVHCIRWQDRTVDASEPGFLQAEVVDAMFAAYLADTLAMVESDAAFEVLAHLDYPKRYWPAGARYDERRFEEGFRAVLRAAAGRGVALEVNTTRGGDPARFLCPGQLVLGWWREEGGRAVAFGSDAHSPEHVAAGFELAAQVVEAAGFRPAADPDGFWTR